MMLKKIVVGSGIFCLVIGGILGLGSLPNQNFTALIILLAGAIFTLAGLRMNTAKISNGYPDDPAQR